MTLDRPSLRTCRARVPAWLLAALLALAGTALLATFVAAQEHPASAAQGPPEIRQGGQGNAAKGEPEEGPLALVAKILNFAIMAGVLVYFLKSPVTAYLAARATQIREDLVSAREMRAAAAAQLAGIERRMRELPAELEALKVRGTEDLRAEQARITQAVAVERARLVDHTRREIDMRLRVARRELTEHAAQLAISLAEQRIRRSITPDDQLRLVDRYTSQLQGAR